MQFKEARRRRRNYRSKSVTKGGGATKTTLSSLKVDTKQQQPQQQKLDQNEACGLVASAVNQTEFELLKKKCSMLEKVVSKQPRLQREIQVQLQDEDLASDVLDDKFTSNSGANTHKHQHHDQLAPKHKVWNPEERVMRGIVGAPKSAGRTPFPTLANTQQQHAQQHAQHYQPCSPPLPTPSGASSPSIMRKIMISQPPSRSKPQSYSLKHSDAYCGSCEDVDTECTEDAVRLADAQRIGGPGPLASGNMHMTEQQQSSQKNKRRLKKTAYGDYLPASAGRYVMCLHHNANIPPF